MQFQANADRYLTTEVLTAPPQRLQLMLIDAAIRLIARARRLWQSKETVPASQSLIHAQQIIDQLIEGVNRKESPELADRVLAVYWFIARRLAEAHAERDENKLQDVVRILEIERETWRQICDKLSGKTDDEPSEGVLPAAKNSMHAPVFEALNAPFAGGLSLEA